MRTMKKVDAVERMSDFEHYVDLSAAVLTRKSMRIASLCSNDVILVPLPPYEDNGCLLSPQSAWKNWLM